MSPDLSRPVRRLKVEEFADGHLEAAWSVASPGAGPGLRREPRRFRLDVDSQDLRGLSHDTQLLILAASVTRALVSLE